MTRLDLKKDLRHLYKPSAREPALVDVPPLHYLMVDGAGDPNNSQSYQEALEALFALSYAIKFMSKQADGGIDYVVMPLEGLWWAENMAEFSMDDRDPWQWIMMIVQPNHITPEMVAEAIAQTRAKKNPAALDLVRFEAYDEGRAAQIMHIGPYANEGPTVAALHEWILAQGYTYLGAGKHHEIYLSDPRRVAPKKMKTIIRQPVIKA
jgi:hypothetical protein